MFCPKCRTEYREGFKQCADCGIPLVPVLPQVDTRRYVGCEIDRTDNLVPVFETADCCDFVQAAEALEENGIPYQGRERFAGITGLGDVNRAPAPYVWTLSVPEEFFEVATEVIFGGAAAEDPEGDQAEGAEEAVFQVEPRPASVPVPPTSRVVVQGESFLRRLLLLILPFAAVALLAMFLHK